MTIDLDSTICEVHGKQKHGAAYGYTKRLGYHPLLATRADSGEVLHARLRKGSANTQRGVKRFIEELVARVRRAGATGTLCVRADSGFYNWELIDTLTRLGVDWSITVIANKQVKAAIGGIDDSDWVDIVYPDGGHAQVAETVYVRRLPQPTPRTTRPTDRASHPTHRPRAGPAVARLALPRIRHQPRHPRS